METVLFNRDGNAVAYIAEDYRRTIYLCEEGAPVAHLHDENHVYGINGRHLGWFIDGVLYNDRGERAGFIFETCPVRIGRRPVKCKPVAPAEMRPKWGAPPTPKLGFQVAREELGDLLRTGQVARYCEEPQEQDPSD